MMRWRSTGFAIVAAGTALLSPRATVHAQRAQEDTVHRLHILPALGVHAGTPQKASIALGVVVGEDWQKDARDHSRKIAIFAEPGLSAGRASLAYINHGYGSFGSGFGVAGTVLRTWKDPWTARENTTYAGAEIIIWPVVFIGPRIGLFRSLANNTTSKKWFVSIDFGIGL
jgi:hypothetical protein